ncbi:MAG: FkbM family methyltransferase [Nostocaceae cyanobacterium]|nr:FkbM family methyltransferase [Nostocaceae cyanobacterium]
MKLATALKPEYFYQPRLALRRILPFRSPSTAEFIDQKLPWGMQIRVRPREEHGLIVSTLGVIDLPVTETLWRLAEPGEVAVDVGANIGYMTAVLAARINSIPGGCVWGFEAHPEIFAELKHNVEQWQKQVTNTKLIIQNIAISEEQTKVTLKIPEDFQTNRGIAAVASSDKAINEPNSSYLKNIIIEAYPLDELFPYPQKIGVLKLDVEGHELHVLKGAKKLLKQQRIRDCVFEEHGDYPTPVSSYFEEMGYSILRIHREFWKPSLLAPNAKITETKWQPISFLATLQPNRAIELFQEPGWKVLKSKI